MSGRYLHAVKVYNNFSWKKKEKKILNLNISVRIELSSLL